MDKNNNVSSRELIEGLRKRELGWVAEEIESLWSTDEELSELLEKPRVADAQELLDFGPVEQKRMSGPTPAEKAERRRWLIGLDVLRLYFVDTVDSWFAADESLRNSFADVSLVDANELAKVVKGLGRSSEWKGIELLNSNGETLPVPRPEAKELAHKLAQSLDVASKKALGL